MEGFSEEDFFSHYLEKFKSERSESEQLRAMNFAKLTEQEMAEQEANNCAERKNLRLDNLPSNKVKKRDFNQWDHYFYNVLMERKGQWLFIYSSVWRNVKALEKDAETLEKFVTYIAHVDQIRAKSSVEIYLDGKEILKDYPDLADTFVMYLNPEEAREYGKYKEFVSICIFRIFMWNVEVHFQNQRQHLLKFLRTFAQINVTSITSSDAWNILQPLIKNHSHLMEELKNLLPYLELNERNSPSPHRRNIRATPQFRKRSPIDDRMTSYSPVCDRGGYYERDNRNYRMEKELARSWHNGERSYNEDAEQPNFSYRTFSPPAAKEASHSPCASPVCQVRCIKKKRKVLSTSSSTGESPPAKRVKASALR